MRSLFIFLCIFSFYFIQFETCGVNEYTHAITFQCTTCPLDLFTCEYYISAVCIQCQTTNYYVEKTSRVCVACPFECPGCYIDKANDTIMRFTMNFSDILCQKENKSSLIARKVLIIPQNYTGNKEELSSIFDVVYEDLLTAFLGESSESFVRNLSIFLLNYKYDLEVKEGFSIEFFRRSKGNISISPLFCSFIDILGCLFANSEEKIMINYKSFDIILYISADFSMSHVILSGRKAFENSVCFSSQKCEELPKFTDYHAIFQIEPIIDDPDAKPPNLIINNVKFMYFFSVLGENNRVLAYFIHNNIYGSLSLSDISIENCYFSYGLFYYQNSTRDHLADSSRLFMNFNNIFINNYNENSIIDENSEEISSIFTINGFFGHINLTNIMIKNAKSFKNHYILAYFSNNDQKTFVKDFIIENISNFQVFLVEKTSVSIKNLAISSSFLQPYSFSIDPLAFLLIESFKILAISLIQGKIGYFLVNDGAFHLSDFVFSLIKDIEFFFSNSNFTIENGTFHASTSIRLFIFDTSIINLRACYFLNIHTNTSLFLLYFNEKVLLESLYFENISSQSCIFEAQNINSLEFYQLFFKNLEFPYFLSPVPNLPFLSVRNTSISSLSCYRMFYITIKTTVVL